MSKRIVVAVGLLLAAAVATQGIAAPAAETAVRLALPAPPGPSRVGTVELRFVDSSRRDPYAPARRREVPARVWYPARTVAGLARSPYMTRRVAEFFKTTFGLPALPLAALRTHGYTGAPVADGEHPVLLLSPPNGNRSGNYTILAENLASEGYVVVALDHPYDSIVVELGGRLVRGKVSGDNDAALRKALAVRIADVRFVLDRLAQLGRSGRFAGRLDLTKIGIFGHSFGGATAAAAMLADSRIGAGVDLDGYLSGEVITRGLDRPFMLMLAPGTFSDPSVKGFYSHLTGPRVAIQIAGFRHLTFGDFSVLRSQFGASLPAGFPSVGSVKPLRGVTIRHTYLSAFFAAHLLGEARPLLDGPSAAYPEVELLP